MPSLPPRSRIRLCWSIAILAACGPFGWAEALAQAPPPAVSTDSSDRSVVMDEVVVRARPLGPAMWKAQRGDSIVIVLGSVSPLPHRPPWDTRRLEAQMSGAREVLLPPSGRPSALEAVSIAVTVSSLKLPRGRSLTAALPPTLRDRYLRALAAQGMDPRRYESWKPGAAGFLLLSDFREKTGLSSAKPGSTVERLAKAKGIRMRRVGAGSLLSLFNGAKRLSPAADLQCLDLALDEIDREARSARATAAAWSAGDLETVRQSYPAPVLESCLLQMPSYRAVVDRGVETASAQLIEALARPGKTIAVIDLNFLLRRDGVLDRLKAAGAEITAPAE